MELKSRDNYDERYQQFKHNEQFRTNQKLFYETLDGKKREGAEQPDPNEATTVWRKIWSEEVSHNKRDLGQMKLNRTIKLQEDININVKEIRIGCE